MSTEKQTLKPMFPPLKGLFAVPKFDLDLGRQFLAEFIASFVFIFVTCGGWLTMIYNGGAASPTLLLITQSVSAFLVSMTMVFAFGEISGAHMNPVFTAGLMLSLKLNWIIGAFYLVIQFLSAFAAVGLLMAYFPVSPNGTLGNAQAINLRVNPTQADAGAWFIQILAGAFVTYFFLYFYYDRRPTKIRDDMTAQEKAEQKKGINRYLLQMIYVPLYIGFLYSTNTLSFNPWRELSVCLIAKDCGKAWIWCLGGFLGALFGALLWMFISGLGQKPPKVQTLIKIPQRDLDDMEYDDQEVAQE